MDRREMAIFTTVMRLGSVTAAASALGAFGQQGHSPERA
jgi:DNA-binding transcriptional LysR family regulator